MEDRNPSPSPSPRPRPKKDVAARELFKKNFVEAKKAQVAARKAKMARAAKASGGGDFI